VPPTPTTTVLPASTVQVSLAPSSTVSVILGTTGTTSSPGGFSGLPDAVSTNTPDWACIRWHESGDNYQAGGMEPYGGAYEISIVAWQQTLDLSGYPALSSPAEQDMAALALWHYALKTWGNPWYPWETAVLCGL